MQKNIYPSHQTGDNAVGLPAGSQGSTGSFRLNKGLRTKIWRIMKLTFLLIALFVEVHAGSMAQTITLSAKNYSLKETFNAIERQTGYVVFGKRDVLAGSKPVTLDVRDMPLRAFLDTALKDQQITYEIKGKSIALSLKPAAQIPPNKAIKGQVTDSATGKPLAGVTIKVKGEVTGTVTDVQGNFGLEVPDNATIVVSYLGYNKREIAVGTRTVVNISLAASTMGLDQLVVIGYGTVKRKDYAGAVSSIKMENSPLELLPNQNALENLKGNVAGLNIGATNSAGGEPGMTIRGQNSINGSNTPLIILDGVMYFGSVSDINPGDIATYDILKDAVSAAAYGSRSSNGVIVITTKKGRTEKPTISFNTSTAFQQWQDKPKMMKAAQWVDLVNARNSYDSGSTYWLKPQEIANMQAGKETNWLDEISRTGVIQNYQVTISGAPKGINYYLSTSYDDNKGIILGDKFNRISVFGKIDIDVISWLKIGADANFSRRNYSGNAANIHEAAIMSPYGVEYRDDEGDLERYPTTQGSSFVNPLWGVDDGTHDNMDIRHSYRLSSYALVTIPWVKGLTYRLNFQNNLEDQKTADFFHENYFISEGPVTDSSRYAPSTIQNYLTSANGQMSKYNTYSYVIDNIINYNRDFNKHGLDVTLVATRDYSKYEYTNMTGSDFSSNGNSSLGYWGLAKATTQKVNLDANKRTNIGFLGRVNYSYDDKYFFTGSLRRDGASVFGANQKWGNFGAAGLAWMISSEQFLKDVSSLNSLKLKISWGQNGNQGVGPYSTLAKIANGPSSGVMYEFSNTGSQIYYGLVQSNMANANLGWELTEKLNAGFESAWLNNRLFVDFDIYTSKTTREIYTPTIPSMNGFTSITSSLGEVRNKGFELTLKTLNVQNKDWNWNTSITYWLNRNKLVHLTGQDLNQDGKEDDLIADGMFIGRPLKSIYGYVQDGIVQPADAEYKAMPGAATIDGYPKYKDISGPGGVPDGKITADDRTILGYPEENFRLNMGNTITYKNLELYIFIEGIFGSNKYYLKSNTLAYLSSTGDGFNTNMSYRPYWTPERPSNVYPAAYFKGDGGAFLGLQSRTFVRVQNISLSYTFKQDWLEKYKLSGLKIYCAANNPMIFTNWVGGDPEIGTTLLSSDLPVASTYSFGLNLSF